MRKLVATVLCAGTIVLMGGCAPQPLRVDPTELKMMPPEAALKLVQRYIPSADTVRLLTRQTSLFCKKAQVWTTYPEIKRAVYVEKHGSLGFFVGDACLTGVGVNVPSRQEAIELAAAMNSLGASIPQVSAF